MDAKDYSDLASQFGGSSVGAAQPVIPDKHVDYAAIAAQYGAEIVQQPPEQEGFLDSVTEMVTGSGRATEETRTLPDWAAMPELNEMSVRSARGALATMLTSPQETAQVLEANFPGVQVRQDSKGNYILRSAIDGEEYAIAPGFSFSDVPRAIFGVTSFTPAGRAATIPKAAAGAGATQGAIEGSQAIAGGEFDVEDVGISAALGPVGQVAQRAGSAARSGFNRVRGGAPTPQPPVQSASQTAVSGGEEAFLEVGELVRKASANGRGAETAKIKLAELAQVNKEAKAAADRLGLDLPFDVFSDNPQIRSAVGLTRSAAGSEAEAAWINSVRGAVDSADDALKQFDAVFVEGRPAPGVASQSILDALKNNQANLADEATKIYDEVAISIPKASTVQLPNLAKTLDEVIAEVGKDGLSTQEKRLLSMLGGADDAVTGAKPNLAELDSLNPTGGVFESYDASVRATQPLGKNISTLAQTSNSSADEVITIYRGAPKSQKEIAPGDFITDDINIAKDYAGGGHVLSKKVKKGDVLDDVTEPGGSEYIYRPQTTNTATKAGGVTYGRLQREKNLIGQALAGKDSPYSNMAAGDLKRLYGALAEDQLANVEAIAGEGMRNQLRAANLLTAQKKGLEKRIVSAFGKEIDGSVATLMQSAIKSAAKGDASKFTQLLKVVPKDLRKETLATALASVTSSNRAAQQGAFGFSEFAKTYRGLRANPTVYKQVVDVLGADADKVMRDLYEISRRITDARAQVLTTGKANQAMLDAMKAEGLIKRVMQSSMAQRAVGAAAGMGGPFTGAIMPDITKAMMGSANKDVVKAAGKLFASDDFQKLAIDAATKQNVPKAVLRRAATSKPFADFANKARLPKALDARIQWLQSAMQTTNQLKPESK